MTGALLMQAYQKASKTRLEASRDIALADPWSSLSPLTQRRINRKLHQAERFRMAVEARYRAYRPLVRALIRKAIHRDTDPSFVRVRVPYWDFPDHYLETFISRLELDLSRGEIIGRIADRMARAAVVGRPETLRT